MSCYRYHQFNGVELGRDLVRLAHGRGGGYKPMLEHLARRTGRRQAVIRVRRTGRAAPPLLTPGQIERICDVCAAWDAQACRWRGCVRDRLLWALLAESGIRIEELTELSHHSLIQYRLPASRELIPLLQIAPSKTDEERLLVVSPELADVLSAIMRRIRGTTAAVPLTVSYDKNERVYNPPMPLLFQWRCRLENRPVGETSLRSYLDHAMAAIGVKDASGHPLRYTFHDFRRLFITDAILHGMPPHIAQLVAGHRDINTTMGYKAVYPEEVINGHRAFIARRRSLRPAAEYRVPTDEEWAGFLGHFERRKVALGDCGRSYDTPCIHEHSCLTEMILSWDASLPGRLGVTHGQIGILAAHASRACRRAGAVRAVSGMSAHSVYRVITLQSVRCLSGVCQSACRLGAFVVGEESGPSRLSDLGLHREFRSASPDEPRGSYEPLMIGEEFPGRSGSSEAVDHCNPDVRVKAE